MRQEIREESTFCPNLFYWKQVDDETQTSVIEGIDKDEEYALRQHINSTLFIGGKYSETAINFHGTENIRSSPTSACVVKVKLVLKISH